MIDWIKKGACLLLVLTMVLSWIPGVAMAAEENAEGVVITQQPVDVSAPAGKSAIVTFTAEGEGLTYQWYYKDKNVAKFSLTKTFTENSYSAVMGDLRDGRQVYCVVTDKYGNSVQTNTVTLSKATSALEITKQPESAAAVLGESVTVSFEVEGSDLTYQWYYRNKGASAFLLTTTFKSNTYTTIMTSARAGREIYCVVTDGSGNTVQTETVTLNVVSTSNLEITQQPVDVTAPAGETATVTFTAEGEGLTYKWYYKDKTATKFSLTTTFKSNTYSAVMGDLRDGRQVYCVVTDQNGVSVQTNTVTLSKEATALTITKQPESVYGQMGEKVTVSFEVEGTGLTYQWFYKNKGASVFTLTNSFKNRFYTAELSAARDGREIYCVVTDKYGNTVQTETVSLNIVVTSVVEITQQPVDVTVPAGETATVTFTAEGEGLTYKWYYKDKTATKFSLTKTFTGNTYSAVMGDLRDGRQVYCVVTDQYGNSVQTNTVTLSKETAELAITNQPVDTAVVNGKEATLTVEAVGNGLTYQWFYKDKGETEFTLCDTATGNTYTVVVDMMNNGREVYCVVTDQYGESVQSDTVTLTVTGGMEPAQPEDEDIEIPI